MDLLFASGSKREVTQLGESAIKDLAIQDILEAISGNERDIIILKEIISSIPKDIRDSVYRQEIMKDFLASDEFTDDIDNVLGLIKTLKDYGSSRTMMRQNDSTLYMLLENLRELSVYVEVIEKRQGLKIACLEGIAYRNGWISEERMREIATPMLKNQYGQYLINVIEEIRRSCD